MGLYDKYVLPRLIHWICGQNPTSRQRQKVIPLAYGDVLEIGIGTGLNLPYYDPVNVKRLTGLDPSEENWRLSGIDKNKPSFEVEFIPATASDIPADNDQFDTIVITYTLCSIPDVMPALEEARRVLKSSGSLIFCEHGLSPKPSEQWWQHKINPIWKTFSGGCNLNRNIPYLLEVGGFKIQKMETMYLPGPKILNYNFWGSARKM